MQNSELLTTILFIELNITLFLYLLTGCFQHCQTQQYVVCMSYMNVHVVNSLDWHESPHTCSSEFGEPDWYTDFFPEFFHCPMLITTEFKSLSSFEWLTQLKQCLLKVLTPNTESHFCEKNKCGLPRSHKNLFNIYMQYTLLVCITGSTCVQFLLLFYLCQLLLCMYSYYFAYTCSLLNNKFHLLKHKYMYFDVF